MASYRVLATMTVFSEIVIDADSADDAFGQARVVDEDRFLKFVGRGEWEIAQVTEI